MKMFSIFRQDADKALFNNVPDALYQAVRRLDPGDIIVIEVQYGGIRSRGRYLPVEYYQADFDAIEYAVSRGIIVVEAAGNGGENLDHSFYEDRFNPQVRDSGAILVGAGGAPVFTGTEVVGSQNDRKRMYFSNYGRRIDVQNWGQNVVTTGYGVLHSDSNRRETYTADFNGTSSAAAVTAGGCAVLQGVAIQLLDRPLTPAEMRQILKDTGSPQVGDAEDEWIGPRPNLKSAIAALDALEK
jgi:subtilisin family serine protease